MFFLVQSPITGNALVSSFCWAHCYISEASRITKHFDQKKNHQTLVYFQESGALPITVSDDNQRIGLMG